MASSLPQQKLRPRRVQRSSMLRRARPQPVRGSPWRWQVMLGRGGLLFAEACAAGAEGEGGAREFALSFVELADRLGRQLADVQRGHALLSTRHVFAMLPAGSRERVRVLEANGIVYSDADYGCVWQGGRADAPLARGAIRDALELGVNVALFRRGVS